MKFSCKLVLAFIQAASAFEGGDRNNDFSAVSQRLQEQQPIASKSFIDEMASFQAAQLIPKIAEALKFDISGLSSDVYNVWAEVISAVPGAMEKLRLPSKMARKKTKDVDWLSVKSSPKFPQYSLKVKSPASLKFDTVKQYSGYLDTADDKHFFYWFFESRNDPKNDPVVLWLNGGPGCSSMMALMEFGPSFVGKGGKLTYNPDAWNSNASIIILDQPVNVGFSYSESETVHDTVQAAKDVYAFLSLFFEQFPEYIANDFAIAGESYAGHYIPVMASEILSHQDAIFNLTSVLIGNGLTDPLHQYDDYQKMACGEGGYPSVLSEEECQGMIDAQPQCNRLIEKCYESQSVWYCVPAAVYCNNKMMGPYQQTGLNVYDIRESCGDNPLCYDEIGYLEDYFNTESVKEALGVEVDQYQACNMQMNQDFLFHGDWMMPYYTAVSDVLNQGLPVLLYEGDKDFICNWVGNEHWAKVLEWKGTDKFAEAPTKKYYVDGKESGTVSNYDIFTFLRVYDAGHMVPFNQHRVSNDFFNRWLSGERDLSV